MKKKNRLSPFYFPENEFLNEVLKLTPTYFPFADIKIQKPD